MRGIEVGDAYRVNAGSLPLREYPEPGAPALTLLARGQILRRVDMVYWNGAWLRVFADVAGDACYEGYIHADEAQDWDGGEIDTPHPEINAPAKPPVPAPPTPAVPTAPSTTQDGRDQRFLPRVAAMLSAAGVADVSSITDDGALAAAIEAFQEHIGHPTTGRLDHETLWELQEPFVRNEPRLKLVRLRTDVPPHEEEIELWLRADAAEAFDRVLNAVRAHGGIAPTAGGLRGLNVKWEPNKGRSKISMHYAALAVDLHTGLGTWKPESDPYVVEWNPAVRRWTVWARAEGGEERELVAAKHAGRWADCSVAFVRTRGRFVNFSDLCRKEGFSPIGPRPEYGRPDTPKTPRNYMSAEWWHFQYDSALVPKISQFGGELLRLDGYDGKVQSAPSLVWEKRKVTFRDGWN